MDFDEYAYLEQTVEDPGLAKGSANDGGGTSGKREREKSSRHRDVGDGDITESRSKRERSDKQNGERSEKGEHRHSSRQDHDYRSERSSSRHRDSPRSSEKDHHRSGRDSGARDGEREKERDRSDRERERDRSERERERERDRVRERDRDNEKEKERDRDRDRDRERARRSSSRSERHRSDHERDPEWEMERGRSRDREAKEKEREREREREIELRDRDNRKFKEKKEAAEPEADPERDQRTVFAYQMPLKASERDVYEFFSRAGKVRDVRLIMDRNSRRSKGVGYIEFYDAMSVPMAIALSGQPLLGQPVMVKPSEAEKNLVQSTASAAGAGGLAGPYSAVARKLYVGNLHFNITEDQLRQVFEAFGPVELVQLPLDSETGHCKGFGFVQFAQLEHAKAAQCLNGKLEIAGRTIKVSAVTDHVGIQDVGANAADFDDDDGGGLSLNASSRAMLMQKLDRTGTATSIVGTLGAPMINGAAPVQPSVLTIPGQTSLATSAVPVLPVSAAEPIGIPSECLLLKNMFDPSTETDPEFDLDIKEDVQEECSNFGPVKHIYVDKNSAGHVYLKFDSVAAASKAQHAMHGRWFAKRMITAVFMVPQQYDAKFKG
ncbi:uncharacterized protein LOC116264517 [Nymphaea colorata]|nr:uncharacterized protein LOC116264517 [Nymphaea colorata]XP_031500653.1 uncharacterized protein LOC116264517 [Nymphaea colorata]XP_031500654.1 uncharacterized protein LOC116264517 [Nymphaea colorata]